MAEFVLKSAWLIIGTSAAPVNLTSRLRSVSISYKAEIQDKTVMGSSGRKRIAGLKDFSVSADFNQDYAASNVDATLFPYIGSTAQRIVVKATSGVVAAGNPRWMGSVLLDSYSPISGGVGDLATVSVSWQGSGVLTRSTAST